LVEADLLNEKSIVEACTGATYVVHTASPFFLDDPTDVDAQLIKPAVNGTLAAMKGALVAGAKRVVVTSSTVAINADPPFTNINPDNWTDIKKAEPYPKSKTLAEQ